MLPAPSEGGVPSWRVIQDIDRFSAAVDAIVKEEGCIVLELDNRNGHRKAASRASRGGTLLPGALRALN